MTITKRKDHEMIHHDFSCDYRGCEAKAPSVASHQAVLPGEWGFFYFMARNEKNEECVAEGHLCPEHVEVVGKHFDAWSVSCAKVDEPPKRFR